ncbi:MAG TPA: hypothetical protein VGB61_07185 [Pyrinomonadaceae bacterium]
MRNVNKRWSEAVVAKLRRRFASREEAEAVAYAIEKILKVPPQEARQKAELYKLRRSELFRLGQMEQAGEALSSLRKMPLPFELSKISAELKGQNAPAYLLSLPLTISSVLLLAYLTGEDTNRQFRLLSTPLARTYLRPVVEGDKTGRVAFLSSAEMLKHNRERGEMPTQPVVYVTFPDHEITRSDTMWRMPFMEDTHQFSIIEPLLFFRGVAPLYTLSAGAEGEPNDLRLVEYEMESPPQVITEAEMGVILTWLALQLETIFRKCAPKMLSWEATYSRSARAMAQVAVMKLKTVEGYIHTWVEADASFDAGTYTMAVEELRKLQETMNNSVEPRRNAP